MLPVIARSFALRCSYIARSPISTFVAGEALPNNHYADLPSAKFSHRTFEFDIGWMYITLLSFIGLSDVKYAREGAHVRVSESTHG